MIIGFWRLFAESLAVSCCPQGRKTRHGTSIAALAGAFNHRF
jgi:hypothetical protein